MTKHILKYRNKIKGPEVNHSGFCQKQRWGQRDVKSMLYRCKTFTFIQINKAKNKTWTFLPLDGELYWIFNLKEYKMDIYKKKKKNENHILGNLFR